MPSCLIKAPTPWLRCNPSLQTRTTDWRSYSFAQDAPIARRREPGMSLGSEEKSSSARISTTAGEFGKPIRRESCKTVISVVDGIGVLLRSEGKRTRSFGCRLTGPSQQPLMYQLIRVRAYRQG